MVWDNIKNIPLVNEIQNLFSLHHLGSMSKTLPSHAASFKINMAK